MCYWQCHVTAWTYSRRHQRNLTVTVYIKIMIIGNSMSTCLSQSYNTWQWSVWYEREAKITKNKMWLNHEFCSCFCQTPVGFIKRWLSVNCLVQWCWDAMDRTRGWGRDRTSCDDVDDHAREARLWIHGAVRGGGCAAGHDSLLGGAALPQPASGVQHGPPQSPSRLLLPPHQLRQQHPPQHLCGGRRGQQSQHLCLSGPQWPTLLRLWRWLSGHPCDVEVGRWCFSDRCKWEWCNGWWWVGCSCKLCFVEVWKCHRWVKLPFPARSLCCFLLESVLSVLCWFLNLLSLVIKKTKKFSPPPSRHKTSKVVPEKKRGAGKEGERKKKNKDFSVK